MRMANPCLRLSRTHGLSRRAATEELPCPHSCLNAMTLPLEKSFQLSLLRLNVELTC